MAGNIIFLDFADWFYSVEQATVLGMSRPFTSNTNNKRFPPSRGESVTKIRIIGAGVSLFKILLLINGIIN